MHTFSVGFSDEKYFDESSYAKMVSKQISTEHTVFNFTNKQLLDLLDDCLDYMDEPFADSSALAVYALSKETRKHATVALSGDGADEMFGGYNKHWAEFLIAQGKYKLLSGISPLLNFVPKSRNSWIGNRSRQLQRYARVSKLNSPRRYWAMATIASFHEASQLLTDQINQQIDSEQIKTFKHSLLGGLKDMNSVLKSFDLFRVNY